MKKRSLFNRLRCHKNEDTKGGVADAKPFRVLLGEESDHEVEMLFFAIQVFEFLYPFFSLLSLAFCQAAEPRNDRQAHQLSVGEDRKHQQQVAKVFIPRYSSFPITHNVHHGKIQELATNVAILNSLKALQGAREVVQSELPGIGHAKGIDEVLRWRSVS